MLRSSRKSVAFRIAPQGYAVGTNGSGRPQWQPWPNGNVINDPAELSTGLKQLPVRLESLDGKVDVILDNSWVRMQVMSIPGSVSKPGERDMFLRARFRSVFGGEVDKWHVVADRSYLGLPVLAMAIDAGLPKALNDFLAARSAKLSSLRPDFIDAFNRLRVNLVAQQGAMAHIIAGRVCMGIWHQRHWRAMRSQPIAAEDNEGLGAMLAQLLAQSGVSIPDGTLHILSRDKWQPDLPPGWELMELPSDEI